MRCPYCGGLNRDQSTFCVNCGRDMRIGPPRQQPPSQTVVNAPNSSTQRGHPTQANPPQRGNAPVALPRPTSQPVPSSRRQPTASYVQAPPAPVLPPEPEAPGPFPPRTLSQFEALAASGAQPYTVVASSIGNGKRKTVRIAYPKCAHWQQAATLFKALKEQQDETSSAIIIQGVWPQQPDVYDFTNGQVQFERNVRLGAQIGNRYIVETADGYEFGAVRFVLNE
jgi:hypothetical protein